MGWGYKIAVWGLGIGTMLIVNTLRYRGHGWWFIPTVFIGLMAMFLVALKGLEQDSVRHTFGFDKDGNIL